MAIDIIRFMHNLDNKDLYWQFNIGLPQPIRGRIVSNVVDANGIPITIMLQDKNHPPQEIPWVAVKTITLLTPVGEQETPEEKSDLHKLWSDLAEMFAGEFRILRHAPPKVIPYHIAALRNAIKTTSELILRYEKNYDIETWLFKACYDLTEEELSS